MTLSKTEMMVVIVSVQLAMVKNHECTCDQNSGFCFVHDCEKLLRRMARETGMPLQPRNIAKPKTEPLPELPLSVSPN